MNTQGMIPLKENDSKKISDRYQKKTYAKGATCIYGDTLYRAKADITTAEEWTAAHWEETNMETIRAEMAAEVSALNANKNILASATFISPNRIESDLELDNINVPGNSINISMAYTIKWEWGFAITMNIDGVYLIQAFFAGQTLAQRYCQLPSRNWHDWDIK